ncbi:uncharacterized protein BDR25DRAFT_22523 [Lindgomyces ingoldianus]|uniref:Uncharacterized protein n=1 Tax=Lindgomyces ingoldianus TaxID=673940 RepID=A0ACB6QXK8_9PLEO|nr:uncharacterized protein BDR25DRAFT_22523 [Lindgomyces ingoldianus]KAF2471733.1 hypothetical protein BDR25DRAFT_22523 [Lindgomyces ingoldianus]
MDDGVLAVAGFCEFCLIDSRLPASDRMRQFTWRHSWQDHYERHYNDAGFIPKCRHRSFDSILELKFHLHDWHGVHIPKPKRQRNGLKRQKCEESEPLTEANKRQKIVKECKVEGGFLNSTVDSIALGLADQHSWSEPWRTSYPSAQKLNSLREAPDTCPDNLDAHAAGSDAVSTPCHSSHDVSKAENAELESLCQVNAIRKCIPSFKNDFIDIDDVFNTSPFDHTLPSILDDIKEEELETIDLTGTGDEGADGALEAFWTDSGYASPGSSASCSHAMIDGDDNDNKVDEKNRLTDRGVVCRAEVQGICQSDLPTIDPILLDITDGGLRDTEMTHTAQNLGVPFKQPAMETQSEDEEYNRPTDAVISHKLVETELHHDVKATEIGNTHLAPSGFGAMSNS